MPSLEWSPRRRRVAEETPERSTSGWGAVARRQAEIAERGLKYLPRDLSQAIDEFEKSELMHEILGDVICENLISAKRAEWEEYRAHVSSWEIDRYLARL